MFEIKDKLLCHFNWHESKWIIKKIRRNMLDHKGNSTEFWQFWLILLPNMTACSSKNHIWFKMFSFTRKLRKKVIFSTWTSFLLQETLVKHYWSHFIILPLTGYEVSGLENLPKGPAILVYYHGAVPLDYYYFIQRIYRLTGRLFYSVIDHIVFHIPGKKEY